MRRKKDNPFAEFDRLTNEIEEMFFGFLGGPRLRMMKGGAFQPLADVFYSKRSNSVTVKLEIPGICPDDVRLTIQDKTLVIEGNRVDTQQEGDTAYQQMEIDYGPFKRKIVLPVEVDVENSTAAYQDGFLTIDLPVIRKTNQAVNVPISVRKEKEE